MSGFYFLVLGLDESDAGRAAKVVAQAIQQEPDPKVRWWLGAGLCLIAERMNAADAAHVCETVATDMAETFVTKKAFFNSYLSNGFDAVASRLAPNFATNLSRRLTDALKHETDASQLAGAALDWSFYHAESMQPTAARIRGSAIQSLIDALEEESETLIRIRLASALASAVDRLDRAEAWRVTVKRPACSLTPWQERRIATPARH